MKSLRVTKSTLTLVAFVPAVVAVNGMVLTQLLGPTGLTTGLGMVFACTAIAMFLIIADIMDRSTKAVSAMRSIGASRKTLASAILLGLLGFGVIGACLGSGLGAAIAGTIGRSIPTANIVVSASLVMVVSVVGVASGAYFGLMLAWKD